MSPFQIDLDRTEVLFCNLDSNCIDLRVVSSGFFAFIIIMALQEGEIIALNLGVGCWKHLDSRDRPGILLEFSLQVFTSLNTLNVTGLKVKPTWSLVDAVLDLVGLPLPIKAPFLPGLLLHPTTLNTYIVRSEKSLATCSIFFCFLFTINDHWKGVQGFFLSVYPGKLAQVLARFFEF